MTPQSVCTVCLLTYFYPCAHIFTHPEREGGGVERRFMFWSFLNGNFCSALMFAALPTRPMLQLWNERRNIYLQPQKKKSKPNLGPIHTHTHSQMSSNLVISAAHSYDTNSDEYIHLLISCWQVTDSLVSLSELWKVQDLYFGLRGRKLMRLQQLISGLWSNESLQRVWILQWQHFFAPLSTSLKYCQGVQFLPFFLFTAE